MSKMTTMDDLVVLRRGAAWEGMVVESFEHPLPMARWVIRELLYSRLGAEEIRKFLQAELHELE